MASKKRKLQDMQGEDKCNELESKKRKLQGDDKCNELESKKRKLRGYDKCDELEWLVDMLGFHDLLIAYMEPGDKVTSDSKLAISRLPSGLIFKRGHWYCKKNGDVRDSYSLHHQISGTAHFCQTFALLYYLRDVDNKCNKLLNQLVYVEKGAVKEKENWANNLRVAVNFWRCEFETYVDLRKWFIEQTRKIWKYSADGQLVYSKVLDKPIGELTYTDLKKFLNWIDENAESLIGCMQS